MLCVKTADYGTEVIWVKPKTAKVSLSEFSAQELCEGQGGCPRLPVPHGSYGHCGRKAALSLNMNFQDSSVTELLMFLLLYMLVCISVFSWLGAEQYSK